MTGAVSAASSPVTSEAYLKYDIAWRRPPSWVVLISSSTRPTPGCRCLKTNDPDGT
jgi:hypothetical protein